MFKFIAATEALTLFPYAHTFQQDLLVHVHMQHLWGKQAASYCTLLDLLGVGWE